MDLVDGGAGGMVFIGFLDLFGGWVFQRRIVEADKLWYFLKTTRGLYRSEPFVPLSLAKGQMMKTPKTEL